MSVNNLIIVLTGFLLIAVNGCAPYQYEPEPIETLPSIGELNKRSFDSPGLRDFISQYNREAPDAGWDLASLTLAAYYFHPQLQTAIAQHKTVIVNQETANLRPNPVLGLPFEYHSDTSDGKSPWTIGLVFDFVLERQAKREARLAQARAKSDVSRTNIYTVAWQIYSELRDRYVAYYNAKKLKQGLQEQEAISEEMLAILQKRLEAGQASEFEVNSLRLELQRIKIAISNQELAEVDARLSLAGAIGIPGQALEGITLPFNDIDGLLIKDSIELEQLLDDALTHRLDIRMALQDYAAYEAGLRFEIEKQYPDLVLSPGFIFDQDDKIWTLGASWILPLFHTQNEAAIKRALSERELKQAEFLALQSRVINEVELALARFNAKKTGMHQVNLLYQEVLDRQARLQMQFDVGYADRLQLYRSNLETALIKQAVTEMQYELVNYAGRIEDAVQYPLYNRSNQSYQYIE